MSEAICVFCGDEAVEPTAMVCPKCAVYLLVSERESEVAKGACMALLAAANMLGRRGDAASDFVKQVNSHMERLNAVVDWRKGR